MIIRFDYNKSVEVQFNDMHNITKQHICLGDSMVIPENT